jgi:hypothetical protein
MDAALARHVFAAGLALAVELVVFVARAVRPRQSDEAPSIPKAARRSGAQTLSMATRASMPATQTKPAKRAAGRTPAGQTPLLLRAFGVELPPELHAYVRERGARKLGKYALHIERASVRFIDVNGPRGGVDTACRIVLVVSRQASIVVEGRGTAAREAFDEAVDVVAQAARRRLGRAWTLATGRWSASGERVPRLPVRLRLEG